LRLRPIRADALFDRPGSDEECGPFVFEVA